MERIEAKYLVTGTECPALLARLRTVLTPDPFAGPAGAYRIRSLYFDDPEDSALRDCREGVSFRVKFRLRYYQGTPDPLWLERKVNQAGRVSKLREPLTREEAERLLAGETDWLRKDPRGLLTLFYGELRSRRLHPVSCIQYDRTAFWDALTDVRVTLDQELRAGPPERFLRPEDPLLPIIRTGAVLEVKWSQALPTVVRKAVAQRHPAQAFSKYATSRFYG